MSLLNRSQELYSAYEKGELSVSTLCQAFALAEQQVRVSEMFISGMEAELAETQKELHYALGKQIRLQAQIDSEEHY